HDVLDAGAVVPGPVEQHDLPGGGELLDVPLEVPLPALALGRHRQRCNAGDAGVEVLRDALDRAALAGGIAALEEHDDPLPLRLAPFLDLDQLGLEPPQLPLVDLLRKLGRTSLAVLRSVLR